MSGHSKWSKIKHKKAANDQDKGRIFTQLSRGITIAILEGGGIANPDLNVRLRLAIEKARANDMPKENINRAIEKALGSEGAALRQVRYEAFASHGVSLIIIAATDNSNRTTAQMRNVLERSGGKLGVTGSAIHLFMECAIVVFPKQDNNENSVLTFVDSAKALDMEETKVEYIVYIPFETLGHIQSLLQSMNPVHQAHYMRPLMPISLPEEQRRGVLALIEELEELDDVTQVFSSLANV